MAYPRSTARVLATATAVVAVVAPAFAADRSIESGGRNALRVLAPTSPAAIAAREDRIAREERRRVEARKARRNPGPFVPVVGKADYGTPENAFGAARSGRMHAGHDMFAAAGTPLVAVDDGVIVEVGSDGGQGNFVYLYDPEAHRTYIYMHLVEPARVNAGQRVSAGELLGGVGCTGSCWGDHLHFEIREGKGMAGDPRDPLSELRRWEALRKPI